MALEGAIEYRTREVIGAGGFTTGISIANDGTKIIRTDTFDAYVRGPSDASWERQLKAGSSVSVSDLDLFYGGDPHPWGQCGTYDAVIAPSNSSVRYIVCMGYVWVTQDAGATYTRCTLAQKSGCQPNETSRMSGRPLAVDPQNPAVVFFGAPDGLHYSTNYGVNWTSVATGTVPAPSAGLRSCVAFDPNSSVSGGRKQGIYILVNGAGLYRSTNGGSTWAAVSGSPANASHLKIGSNGYVYLAGNGSNDTAQFRRFDGVSTWIAPTGITAKSIAVSPHNAGHIYLTQPGGGLDVSTDYGATWVLGGSSTTTNSRQATDIGWFEYTDEDFMTNGDIEFDPLVNRIWAVEGCGAWYTDNPPSTFTYNQPTTWVEASRGVENMVTTLLTVASDGTLGCAIHDRGHMIIPADEAGEVFPAKHGGTFRFQHGGMIDYAAGDTSFWAGTMHQERIDADEIPGEVSKGFASTSDAGANWTASRALMTASTGAGGGNIVVFDANRWLIVQTNRAFPLAGQSDKNGIWRTSDAGATWTKCTIGTNEALDFHSTYVYCRRVLIGDKFTDGRAFAYNVGDGTGSADDLACKGIWRTTDYGATWTRVRSTTITTRDADYYHGKFTQGSGADEWYFCGGDACLGLWRSTDGMATWSQVTGTDDINGAASFGEVFGIGVGKERPGSAYKTLLAAGWRMAVPAEAASVTGYGFWISFDNGATWERFAQFPDGIFDTVNDIAGDPSRYGRFYVGWGGTGVSLIDYRDVRLQS